MTFSSVLSAIEAHAQTAGASLTDPMTDVCIGLPVPRGRCGRVYWDGETDAPRMPGRYTGNTELTGDRIVVRWFWPIGSADEAAHASRVVEMQALAVALREAIDEDGAALEALGVYDIEVGQAEPDIVQIGGSVVAISDTPLVVGYREQEIT